jgi:iron complex outermembrane receptor protein
MYRMSLLSLACALACAPGVAGAQESAGSGDAEVETTLDSVVVTGTRIRGAAPVGAPVRSIDQEDIKATSATTLTEMLRYVPQVANIGADDSRFNAVQGANGNLTAGSTINLRGLGGDATLSLIGGRRVPISPTLGTTAGTGGFDVSLVPTAAVGRLEVMADGGSALYGADAVGGVVNILMRNPFDGAEAGVRYGWADGFNTQSIDAAFGRTWGSGGIMVAAQLQERDRLAASKRSYFTDDLRGYGGTDGRSYSSAPGNVIVGSTRYAIPAGQDGTNLRPQDLIAGAPNRQSAHAGADALPQQERRSVAMNFEQQLGESLRWKAQGLYAVRESERSSGPGGFLQTLTVPNTNPFFVHPLDPAARSVSVAYNLQADFGNQVRTATERVAFITTGLEWDITQSWTAELFGSFGYNRQATNRNEINSRAMAAALADSNPDTAFNPFGMGGQTNPQTLASIRATNQVNWEYEMQHIGASANGGLFKLPGGEVKLAVGLEHLRSELGTYERRNTGTPDISTYAITDVSGVRRLNSAYAELLVPVVGKDNARPGIQNLSLSLAARHDDYSDVGTTSNPKFGFNWTPVEGLQFRGSYGKSFKAPAGPGADKGLVISVMDFVDPKASGGTTRSLWVRSGVEGLRPETATIWSLGMDLRPVSLPGLDVTLNYFNVDYSDRIAAPGNDTSPLTKETMLADFITRNPGADLVNHYLSMPSYTGLPQDPATIGAFVDGRPRNIGRVKTDGIEFGASYRWWNDSDDWVIGVDAQHVMSYEQALLPTTPMVDYANTINYPLGWTGRARLGWSRSALSATAFVNYAGSYENTSVASVPSVDAYTTVDLSLRYSPESDNAWLSGVTFSLDVNNLLDKEPPVVINGNLAFDPQVASVVQRQILFGIRKSW